MNRQPITLEAYRRIRTTRRVVEAATWRARAAVIRQQLVAMRRTYPA